MKTSWILTTAGVAAGHLMIADALAAPPAGNGMTAPALPDLIRVQAVQPPEHIQDRMARLRQHRSILKTALQSPGAAAPSEMPVPQARDLRPPAPMNEPMSATATAPLPEDSAGEGQGLVTCEDAAGIVADFGFSDIGTSDCSGDFYRFAAMRDGTAYAIAISPATGEIAEVSRQ